MNLVWVEESDGDWRLEVDGQYYGICCPHHTGHVVRAWGCGDHSGIDATMDEAKRTMEHSARADAAADAARAAYNESIR